MNIKVLFISFLVCLFHTLSISAEKKNDFSFKRGINISHWLSQSDARGESRACFFTEKDIKYLAGLGFDHLRIPIDEEQMFSKEGKKEKEAFLLLHNALTWCQKYHMNAVVDLHILRSHFFNADKKPLFTERKEQIRFYHLWEQLSGELKQYPTHFLAYEMMNEPVADDHETWNRIVNECVQHIRVLEPERSLIIGSNQWQSYETVPYLKIPENDPNIIISFHYYNPFLLTHYQASWTDVKDYKGAVHYPGPLISDNDMKQLTPEMRKKYTYWNKESFDKAKIEKHIKTVIAVAKQYNLPVYCGEFGCITQAPKADKERWYKDLVELFDKYNISRANWDYKGGFGILVQGEEQTTIIKTLTEKK